MESEAGTKYTDVDLSEGEWVEYDEKLGDSIGIYELEHKLQPHHWLGSQNKPSYRPYLQGFIIALLPAYMTS